MAVRCVTTPPSSGSALSDFLVPAGAYDLPMTEDHPIKVSLSERGSILLVQVSGELDLATSPELMSELNDVDWEDRRRVVFDLLGVEFMDSSGLGTLIALRNEHPDTEIALVTDADGLVNRVLRLTAMEELFPIHSSTEAALA